LDTQKVCYDLEDVSIPHDGGVLISTAINHKLQVTQVEDSNDELAGLCYVSFRQTDSFKGDLELVKSIRVIVKDSVWSRAKRVPLAEVAINTFVQ
jgi:hypothetical protein